MPHSRGRGRAVGLGSRRCQACDRRRRTRTGRGAVVSLAVWCGTRTGRRCGRLGRWSRGGPRSVSGSRAPRCRAEKLRRRRWRGGRGKQKGPWGQAGGKEWKLSRGPNQVLTRQTRAAGTRSWRARKASRRTCPASCVSCAQVTHGWGACTWHRSVRRHSMVVHASESPHPRFPAAMREAFGSSSSRSHPRAEGTLASSASHNPARHGHSKSNGHPSSQPHPHHLRHHALHPRAQHHPPMHVTPTRHQGFWETRHQGSHAHAPDPLGSHRSTATFHAAVSTPPNTPAPSVTSPAGMRRGTASWGCATPAANTPHSLSTVAPSAAGAALPTPERAGGVPGCPESVPRSSLGHSSPISSLSPQPVARLPRVASNLTRELRRVESSGAVAVGTARNAGKSSSAKEALPEPGEGRSGRGQSEAALSALGRHGSCDARLGPGAVAAGLEEVGVGTAGSSEVAVGTVGREGAGVQPPELNGAGPACEGGDPRRPTRRGSSAKEGRHNADTGVPGTPSTPGLGRLRAGSARLGAWPSTDLGSLGSAPTSRPSPWGPGLTTSVSRTTSSVPRSADHKDPFLLEELFTPAATTPGANAVALGSEDFLCLRCGRRGGRCAHMPMLMLLRASTAKTSYLCPPSSQDEELTPHQRRSPPQHRASVQWHAEAGQRGRPSRNSARDPAGGLPALWAVRGRRRRRLQGWHRLR